MQIGQEMKFIKELARMKRQMCPFCGNSSPADAETWVCCFCENANSDTMLSIRMKDGALLATLSNVESAIGRGDFENALKEYNGIVARYNDPGFIYAYGLLHIQYSNSLIASISYDRKGFMEENAVLKENAVKVASKAKMILNKANVICKRLMTADTHSELLAYTLFIINIKLKKIKTAKRAILILKDLKSNYLASYAEMVLNAEIGNYKETLKVAQTLPADSANAFYYMGWALFKMGKESEAKKLIGALSLQFQSEVTVALSSEIEKAMRII